MEEARIELRQRSSLAPPQCNRTNLYQQCMHSTFYWIKIFKSLKKRMNEKFLFLTQLIWLQNLAIKIMKDIIRIKHFFNQIQVQLVPLWIEPAFCNWSHLKSVFLKKKVLSDLYYATIETQTFNDLIKKS